MASLTVDAALWKWCVSKPSENGQPYHGRCPLTVVCIKTQSKWPALLWTLPSNSGVYQNPAKMASHTVDAALEARGWRVKHCTTLSDWLIMVRNLNVFFDCKSSTELILEDEMDTAGQTTGHSCSPMLFIPSSTFLCHPPPPLPYPNI